MMIEHDQHIMTDERLLRRIARAAALRKTDRVLEIGAGPGNLTRLLCARAGRVTAVEIDRGFEEPLAELRQEAGNLDLVFGDALRYLRAPALFDVLVSNVPYAIAEPLVQALCRLRFRQAVLTVPARFAGLLSGQTRLGFVCSAFFAVRPLFPVPAAAFEPPPKTRSQALSLSPVAPRTAAEGLFRRAVCQRDKKAGNAVRKALLQRAREAGNPLTQRESREILKRLRINNRIEGTKIASLGLPELRSLAAALARI